MYIVTSTKFQVILDRQIGRQNFIFILLAFSQKFLFLNQAKNELAS